MDILDTDTTDSKEGKKYLSPQLKTSVEEISKWAKFLGVIGFISLGLIIMAGFNKGSDANKTWSLIFAVIFFFPVLYMFNFGRKGLAGIKGNSKNDVEDAFENLRSFFRFFGVISAILVGIFGIGLTFATLSQFIR